MSEWGDNVGPESVMWSGVTYLSVGPESYPIYLSVGPESG